MARAKRRTLDVGSDALGSSDPKAWLTVAEMRDVTSRETRHLLADRRRGEALKVYAARNLITFEHACRPFGYERPKIKDRREVLRRVALLDPFTDANVAGQIRAHRLQKLTSHRRPA